MNLADSTSSPFHLVTPSSLAGVKGMELLKREARAFLELMAKDSVAGAWIPDVTTRWNEIELEIQETGTYIHTKKELTFGCRVAWRNSNRCIGRHFWRTLHVNDARDCTSSEQALTHLKRHVNDAFNGGQIANVITVFPAWRPGTPHPWRMLNHQLVRFAGFKNEDGSVMGDPDSVELTTYCLEQGWKPNKSPWTPLPWVLLQDEKALLPHDPFEKNGLSPHEVLISHPDFPQTSALGLRWYAVPILADMALKIGGIVYPLAPFNGHYLSTEIAARNLVDPDRYNALESWAKACDIDTESKRNLWKDEALVRLNQALVHSFDSAGVTVGDHHELGRAFEQWCQAEQKQGRDVPGDWSWLTPPMSGSLTPQYHRNFNNSVVTHTNFFYQEPASVRGLKFSSTAKDTHRLLAGDALAEDVAPKKCPFTSLGKHLQSLWK